MFSIQESIMSSNKKRVLNPVFDSIPAGTNIATLYIPLGQS
jgi:hypothetical protein